VIEREAKKVRKLAKRKQKERRQSKKGEGSGRWERQERSKRAKDGPLREVKPEVMGRHNKGKIKSLGSDRRKKRWKARKEFCPMRRGERTGVSLFKRS